MKKIELKKASVALLLSLIIVIGGLIGFVLTQKNDQESQQSETNIPKPEQDVSLSDELIALGYPRNLVETLTNVAIDKAKFLITLPYDEENIYILLDPYAKIDNFDRYKNYLKDTNTDYTVESDVYKVVLFVNNNRDYPFYENTTVIKDPDNILVIVNKYYYLDENYRPNDLITLSNFSTLSGREGTIYGREEAVNAFEKMNQAMQEQIGKHVEVSTAFRDYAFQNQLYTSYVNESGIEEADKVSARPGHSEHQTGLTFDCRADNGSLEEFYSSQQYQWLQSNAYKYGFIQRYKNNIIDITGYNTEEWHYRYVGVEAATAIYEQNISLEEYVMINN